VPATVPAPAVTPVPTDDRPDEGGAAAAVSNP